MLWFQGWEQPEPEGFERCERPREEGVKTGLTVTECSLIMVTQSFNKGGEADLISALVLWSSTRSIVGSRCAGRQRSHTHSHTHTCGSTHAHCHAPNIHMHSNTPGTLLFEGKTILHDFAERGGECLFWHDVAQMWNYNVTAAETDAFTCRRRLTAGRLMLLTSQ